MAVGDAGDMGGIKLLIRPQQPDAGSRRGVILLLKDQETPFSYDRQTKVTNKV